MIEYGYRKLAIAAVTAVSSLLGACVVEPVPPYSHGGVVMTAPPPPLAETYGVAPGPDYFWIGGYWDWVGGRHIWRRGHWARNRPGYSWVPNRWHREGRGWRPEPGHWKHR